MTINERVVYVNFENLRSGDHDLRNLKRLKNGRFCVENLLIRFNQKRLDVES